MRYYGKSIGNNRAAVVRCESITDKLKAIRNLQQRTGNKKLFEGQREKLMKELSQIRREI
ncbi:hypothetical protein D2A34_24745 [Clostridium chromiireducens]|uniref:Uncharacterized protein n=1 Tax=Clostridium chromiireducens TaxID=225345 RepID=A0A399IH82_9CLOT|nr:hypothetical protein [Clostridium chromiireducens]RII32131.1 hypothetical protein D2A34_24745 [Clostridium chromiireducens]